MERYPDGNVYGVVLCPRCKQPRGVRLQAKTATCQCGKTLHIQRLRVLIRTDSAADLPTVVGRIRAQMAGRLEEFEEAMLSGERVPVPRGSPNSLEKVLEALRSLSTEGFTASEAERVLNSMGLEGARILEALIREGLVYEVGNGRYRLV